MKSKGFTIIELMIVVAILGILCSIAIPNFIKFRCRSEGRKLSLNEGLVKEVCSNCTGCIDISSIEALQMIKDGEDPSRFIEWKYEPIDKPKPEITYERPEESPRKLEDFDSLIPEFNDPPKPTDWKEKTVKRPWKD